MTPYDFFRLVEQLRNAQREYFRDRHIAVLKECKRLEGKIDLEIARTNSLLRERQNKLKKQTNHDTRTI